MSDEAATFRGFTLDPFQRQAVKALDDGLNVIVAAPTGAGKTLVAEYAIEQAFERQEKVFYTAPIKALSNQKFRDFGAEHGDLAGIMTGDVTLNPAAPVQVMTTEIFRNCIFDAPERLDGVRYVVFDEVHYLADIERGTVWEESIIYAPPHLRFLCLSATVPNVEEIGAWMTDIREVPTEVIVHDERPVPLRHHFWIEPGRIISLEKAQKKYRKGKDKGRRGKPNRRGRRGRGRGRGSKLSSADLLSELIDDDKTPLLYFCFGRRATETLARAHRGRRLLNDADRDKAVDTYDALCRKYDIEAEPSAYELRNLISAGIAHHHAGMMPALKEVVERMFGLGLVPLIFTTETFAMGINFPARAVVFDGLRKFDGVEFGPMQCHEYWQMAGRAGRRGMDDVGWVYAVLDENEIDPKSALRVVTGPIEAIESQFSLAYSVILSLWQRIGSVVFEHLDHSLKAAQGGDKVRQRMHDELKARLRVLRDFDYLHDDDLTAKGRFARRLYGYELPVAEAVHEGLLDTLTSEQLGILFAAVVFESRRNTWYKKPRKGMLGGAGKGLVSRVKQLQARERELGLSETVREPDFNMSEAVRMWMNGCDLAELEAATDADEGDLIRTFRMTVQQLRMVRDALADDPTHEALTGRLRKAVRAINRDVVDAEKQLRVG